MYLATQWLDEKKTKSQKGQVAYSLKGPQWMKRKMWETKEDRPLDTPDLGSQHSSHGAIHGACDLSKANQWTSLHRLCNAESKKRSFRWSCQVIWTQESDGHLQQLMENIYLQKEGKRPTHREEERGEMRNRESRNDIICAPGTGCDKARKTLGLNSYMGQYIPFSPWAHFEFGHLKPKRIVTYIWPRRLYWMHADHRLHSCQTIFNTKFCGPRKPLPPLPFSSPLSSRQLEWSSSTVNHIASLSGSKPPLDVPSQAPLYELRGSSSLAPASSLTHLCPLLLRVPLLHHSAFLLLQIHQASSCPQTSTCYCPPPTTLVVPSFP